MHEVHYNFAKNKKKLKLKAKNNTILRQTQYPKNALRISTIKTNFVSFFLSSLIFKVLNQSREIRVSRGKTIKYSYVYMRYIFNCINWLMYQKHYIKSNPITVCDHYDKDYCMYLCVANLFVSYFFLF